MSLFTDLGQAEATAAWAELPFAARGDVLTVRLYRSIEQKRRHEEPERTVVFMKRHVLDLSDYANGLAFGILRDPTKRWKTEDGMYKTYYKTHILTGEEFEAIEAI